MPLAPGPGPGYHDASRQRLGLLSGLRSHSPGQVGSTPRAALPACQNTGNSIGVSGTGCEGVKWDPPALHPRCALLSWPYVLSNSNRRQYIDPVAGSR